MSARVNSSHGTLFEFSLWHITFYLMLWLFMCWLIFSTLDCKPLEGKVLVLFFCCIACNALLIISTKYLLDKWMEYKTSLCDEFLWIFEWIMALVKPLSFIYCSQNCLNLIPRLLRISNICDNFWLCWMCSFILNR